MPWTEKQLRLFRAAAHNPEIAKRTGIKQSDAERMSKEGLKKMAGGGEAKQKILRQDTRHGKVDMPFAKLGRFSGMKKGGFMKKRRFDEGGDVDDLEQAGYSKEGEGEDTVYRKTFVSTPRHTKESEKETVKSPAKSVAKSAKSSAAAEPPKSKKEPSSAFDFVRKSLSPDVRADLSQSKKERIRERFKEKYGFRKGGSVMRSKKDIGKDQMGMAPYRKGGEMESKAMVKKEIGFMKKKGAPASMIKHEKAEMRGMKKGGHLKETMGPRGMGSDVEGGYKAKHLKHGEHSEQKRGHTRGTIVKMAAGGSVRAHGEHSIQLKGHTRGKIC